MLSLFFTIFIGVPVFIVIYLIFALKRVGAKATENRAEENNEKLGPIFEITKSNVRILYLNNKVDDYLRKEFPSLKSWNARGENVAIHYEGMHVIDLLFFDGTQKVVVLRVKDSSYFIGQMEVQNKKSPEEVAAEWIEQWKDYLLEKHNRNEGFVIEREKFPEDENILEIILDKISLSGNFSTQYTESGILFAIE